MAEDECDKVVAMSQSPWNREEMIGFWCRALGVTYTRIRDSQTPDKTSQVLLFCSSTSRLSPLSASPHHVCTKYRVKPFHA